jgi:tektin-3
MFRETEERTKHGQRETGRRLGERIHDIRFWKEELHTETNKLIAETAQLEELKKNLRRALAETETPLQAAQECLLSRENRQGW